MTRVIGPPKSRRRRWTFLWCLTVAVAAGIIFIPGALAVHDEGVFELDGNACTQAASSCTDATNPQSQTGGEDWDKVFGGTSGAERTSFVTDGFGAGDSILNGGATKDINDLQPSWLWKQTTTTSVQDKDDIEHAFAAQYRVDKSGAGQQCGTSGATADCVLLYFGADRFSNSGDSVMGFWFFKSKVSKSALDANGNGTFIGHHTAATSTSRGDILVVSDFRAGGKAPSIQVYEWVTSGGSASTHLNLIGGGDNPAGCTQSPPEKTNGSPVPPVGNNDNFCATANQNVVHSPWAYTPKSNSGGTAGPDGGTAQYGVAEFMEGGINMTALGLGNECFSSFLAESRSSHAVTSTLSDFALGGFGQCGATFATQTSKTTLAIGDSAPTDKATISASSSGGTPPAPTGNVSFFLCGPSPTAITSCDPTGKTAFDTESLSGVTPVGNAYSVTSTAPTISSAGYYCFAARWPGDTTNYTDGPYGDDGTNECFQVTPLTPTVTTQVNHETDDPVVPGTALNDTATLSGTATPSNATQGTITFRAYGPAADTTTCTAPAVYTSVITVNGNNDYLSSNGDANGDGVGGEPDDVFAPTDPGNYNWTATYAPATGDVNNVGTATACGDAHEGSVVQQFQPTLSTNQTVTIKDSTTITVTGGGDLDGTAHFQPFGDSSCTAGDDLAAQDDVAVSGPSGTSVDSSVMTITDPGVPTIYWKVSYTSNNGAQKSIDAACVENSSLTVTDG
jgi:hypothetical protein